MFGPPEKVHIDWKDTSAPGLILRDHGKGRVAWLPWDIAGLYYLHSSQAHAGMLRDLIDHLLPEGRQLRTNAHPLVEFSWMAQRDRHLLHVMNLSGHSQTAYFDPVPMTDIEIKIRGKYGSALQVSGKRAMPVRAEGAYTVITLPRLEQYELIEMR
jgi:hypothetical protein